MRFKAPIRPIERFLWFIRERDRMTFKNCFKGRLEGSLLKGDFMDTFATAKLLERLKRLSDEHFFGDVVVFLRNDIRISYENVGIGPVSDTRWLHIYDDRGREEMVLLDEIVRIALTNKNIDKNDSDLREKSSENTKTCSCSEENFEEIEAFKRDFFENSEEIEAFKRDFFESLKKHFGVERSVGDD